MSETGPTTDPPVKGVFVTETTTTVGFGGTKRRVQQSVYVYAESREDGTVSCRPLNAHYIPQQGERIVSREDLLSKFSPAPHIYYDKMLPALRKMEQAVDTADRCRSEGQLFTAEFEYKNALRVDENHVRASFGLGLTYLERGDAPNADIVFRKLSRLKETFAPEHKHLFNEFGIQLRKNGMHAQALGHYARALRLSGDDENLYYNLARALFEKGTRGAAKRMLQKALAMRPGFPEAVKFMRYLEQQVPTFEVISDSSLEITAERGSSTDEKFL